MGQHNYPTILGPPPAYANQQIPKAEKNPDINDRLVALEKALEDVNANLNSLEQKLSCLIKPSPDTNAKEQLDPMPCYSPLAGRIHSSVVIVDNFNKRIYSLCNLIEV